VYGLPIYDGALRELIELRKYVDIILMIDNDQHIDLLEQTDSLKWDVFIKLDVGSHRAGVRAGSPALKQLVDRAEGSSAVKIHGFYCHAGHSYAGRSQEEAEKTLDIEVSSVLDAARLLPSNRNIVVSIGATPTAHVIQKLAKYTVPNVAIELHAGT
jgi:D-serine ammonia-lyase